MALLTRTGAAALLLFTLGPVIAAAQGDQPVGQVVQAAPRVEGKRQGREWEPLKGPQHPPKKASPVLEKRPEEEKGSDVYEGMAINTFTGAGARILINPDLPARKGVFILGPNTQIELTERSLTAAGSLKKLSWLVKLGQFRLALLPRNVNTPPGEGESFIYTAARDLIQLTGTDVAVQVAEDGTLTVWVFEGEVEVTAAAGGKVRVPGRHRTRVLPGRGPETPVPFDPAGESGPGPSPYPGLNPGETIFPDPPHLDLRALRLDLPL